VFIYCLSWIITLSLFQRHPSAYKADDAKKIVKNYNRMGKVLIEYESMFHQAWRTSVEVCTNSMCSVISVIINCNDFTILQIGHNYLMFVFWMTLFSKVISML